MKKQKCLSSLCPEQNDEDEEKCNKDIWNERFRLSAKQDFTTIFLITLPFNVNFYFRLVKN
jgi:hypothetical protein